jgi:hypothetical protein
MIEHRHYRLEARVAEALLLSWLLLLLTSPVMYSGRCLYCLCVL